jgi:hypothetical protein
MDLRGCNLSPAKIELASRLLNYQPFFISDDLQTGVAYSWLYSEDARTQPPLVFHHEHWNSQWDKITSANARLRQMYDDFIEELASRFPGGSLFDVACNNGYFPVRAATRGMRGCAGSDRETGFGESIQFLNDAFGTNARFILAPYDPTLGRGADAVPQFDVVVATAILCHIPDPLNFLAYLGAIAKEAIFFWGQMLDTDELAISYQPPHEELSTFHTFPYCFNDNTRISKGLFRESARLMGFREVTFLAPKPH